MCKDVHLWSGCQDFDVVQTCPPRVPVVAEINSCEFLRHLLLIYSNVDSLLAEAKPPRARWALIIGFESMRSQMHKKPSASW